MDTEHRINPSCALDGTSAEQLYWDNIRAIHYLFSPSAVRYARGYLKAGQKRYYEKKKDEISRQRAERYRNDPEYRERVKRVASERGRRVRAMRNGGGSPADPLPVVSPILETLPQPFRLEVLEEVEVDSLPVTVEF